MISYLTRERLNNFRTQLTRLEMAENSFDAASMLAEIEQNIIYLKEDVQRDIDTMNKQPCLPSRTF